MKPDGGWNWRRRKLIHGGLTTGLAGLKYPKFPVDPSRYSMRATFLDYDLKAVLPAERHEKTALQTPTCANCRPRRRRRVRGMPRVPRSLRVQRTEGHEYRGERRG